MGSERGDSSGSSEGKQRTKGQLVCHEHPGGGLKPRPGPRLLDHGGFISLVSFSYVFLFSSCFTLKSVTKGAAYLDGVSKEGGD